MDSEHLQFPDHPRSELETTIGDLIDRAQRVLQAQGRLRGLLRASHAVIGDLELQQVLRHIAEAALTLVDAEYAALGVIDRDGRLDQFIHVGMPADVAHLIGHLPEGHGILGAVIESEHPIRLERLSEDPRAAGFPQHHPPMTSFLGVPVRVRGEIFGNLYLTNRAGGTFTDEDEELVLALASTAAIAIDNARRYEEAQRLQRLSSALAEITAALLAADTGSSFGVLAERVASLVEVDLVYIVVPDPVSGNLRVDTARGVGSDSIEGAELPDDSAAARAIAGGDVVVLRDVGDRETTPLGLLAASTVAVPLLVSGVAAGALCGSRRSSDRRFSAEDLSTLAEFAAQAGIALALAQARADRQRLDLVEERARIARDLHDNVIQRLFGAGLGLQALAAKIPAHADSIAAYVAEIDAAIADFRTAIFALRTTDLGSFRHRLLDVANDAAALLGNSPRVAFTGPIDLMVSGVLADDAAAVVREALSNVARHAQATTAEVSVSVTDSRLDILVEDDGVGIPSSRAHEGGIVNLLARARAHGGTCEFEPREAGGTRVRWSVPLGNGGSEVP